MINKIINYDDTSWNVLRIGAGLASCALAGAVVGVGLIDRVFMFA